MYIIIAAILAGPFLTAYGLAGREVRRQGGALRLFFWELAGALVVALGTGLSQRLIERVLQAVNWRWLPSGGPPGPLSDLVLYGWLEPTGWVGGVVGLACGLLAARRRRGAGIVAFIWGIVFALMLANSYPSNLDGPDSIIHVGRYNPFRAPFLWSISLAAWGAWLLWRKPGRAGAFTLGRL